LYRKNPIARVENPGSRFHAARYFAEAANESINAPGLPGALMLVKKCCFRGRRVLKAFFILSFFRLGRKKVDNF